MLIHLDETLNHQSSRPFRMAGSTDHRFFDRYWFEAVDPRGAIALIAGMAFYKNLGTCDGYVSVREGFEQHNLRLARPLDDDPDTTTLGPLRIQVVEPYRHLRMELDQNPSGLALELDWRSEYPAYVEAHHLDVVQERVTQDSTRYNQVGWWDGWVEVSGTRHDVDRWWGGRDHSWGVRPGVGGFEPATGRAAGLWIWVCFTGDGESCQFQVREDGEGRRVYFDGAVVPRGGDGRPPVPVADVEYEVRFTPGTRQYEHVAFRLTLAGGRVLEIDAEPLGRPWAYTGTGYDNGYLDGRGLGAQRGLVLEHDVYDLTEIERATVGGVEQPTGHREQPARVVVDGYETVGHIPVMTRGALPKYGLA